VITIDGKNQIILLLVSSEIFPGVINDMSCSNGARHIQIPRAAHGGHFSPERFGKLYGKHTHTNRGALDQNFLPGPDPSSVAKALQSGERRHGHGRGFLEGWIGWLQRQISFSGKGILSKSAMTTPEYLIPRPKLLYVSAN
jgi:hypothetical protein